MRAVTEVHALKVERAFVDFQLSGVVRAVQKYADSALIDTGGILVGEFTVRIHRREGEVAAAQHSRAVSGQHRAAARLRNGFQHRVGDIVGIGAVDKLQIINIEIARTLGAVLGGYHTNRIGSGHINRHLEGGNICFHPSPILTGPVVECASTHCAIIVTIVLHIGCCTVKLLAVHIAYAAVLIELHI